ncbi:hypothetical protein COY00_01935 [Candidatus Pacearchaeota archaeon CG_4_10_14_0_2_um_filter_35_33]|nr:glycosyltransferase [Candidatus Pacearchaeota archaeon]PIY81280.1 MAG: hypothetical protein COY79_03290 [Candidatus Pacearchaeota archaeon CG_4_10_14_0_8_um_filter_35_169]PIZ80209.1 MAG: hypothetical protein COY00_01935 [Candidatus Pacearchaeota archaeon CG_4_10_14_0_2_um_filter_35_33]
MKVSIIIPAYNEEKRIGNTLNRYNEYFSRVLKGRGLDYEILVVINNTTDNTKGVVEKFSKKNKRINYLELERGGKGFAVLSGFKKALSNEKNDLIGFVDADLATPPEEFHKLINSIKRCDVAIASRLKKGSKILPKFTLKKKLITLGFSNFVRFLMMMPHKDTQCGAKLFRNNSAKYVVENVVMSKWAFDVEVLYKLRKEGHRIIEVPSVWFDVQGSKIDIKKDSIRMFLAIWQLRIVNSPFRGFLKPGKPMIDFVWRFVK